MDWLVLLNHVLLKGVAVQMNLSGRTQRLLEGFVLEVQPVYCKQLRRMRRMRRPPQPESEPIVSACSGLVVRYLLVRAPRRRRRLLLTAAERGVGDESEHDEEEE